MSGQRTHWIAWAPLTFVALLGLVFVWGLSHGGDRLIASHWINKPMPTFVLPAASADRPGLLSSKLSDGRARIVNVFASWCIPCRVEAPQLEALRARGVIIEGVAVRDRSQDLARYLAENGNPYASIGADERGQVQIALGSSGVPESFLVDGNGIIREQIQGVITAEAVPSIIAKLEVMQQ